MPENRIDYDDRGDLLMLLMKVFFFSGNLKILFKANLLSHKLGVPNHTVTED